MMMCLMGDTDRQGLERIRSMGDRAIKKNTHTCRCAQKLQRQLCFPLSLYAIVFIIIISGWARRHGPTSLRSPANCTHTVLRACLKYSMDISHKSSKDSTWLTKSKCHACRFGWGHKVHMKISCLFIMQLLHRRFISVWINYSTAISLMGSIGTVPRWLWFLWGSTSIKLLCQDRCLQPIYSWAGWFGDRVLEK